MMAISSAKYRLCFRVKRNRSDSLPTRPTAAQATAIDCGDIILPVTPPVVLAPIVRIGLTPICCAVTACRLANRALLDVAEPVRNTPSQPRKGEKNGNSTPDAANARPRVEDMPE